MQIRSSLAVLLFFSGIGVAHAQVAPVGVPVESKLTVNLAMNVTEPSGNATGSAIRKVRFNTKDLINVMRDATGLTSIDKVELLRITDPDDDNPGIVFLNQPVFFLDKNNQILATGNVFTQTGTTPSGLLASTASAVKVSKGQISSRKDLGIEETLWSINGRGTADQLNMQMVANDALDSKRLTQNGRNEGLIFTKRQAGVNGGVGADLSPATTINLNATGVLSGDITASSEKVTKIDVNLVSVALADRDQPTPPTPPAP